MKNRFVKASFSVILAIVVIFSSTISFGAAFVNETNDAMVLDKTISLKNNEILFSSYNVSENYVGSISLEDVDGPEVIEFAGTECIDAEKIVKSTPNVVYDFYTCLPNGAGGGHSFKFDNSGGVYRKVRVKLSRSSYFNEDGSHTTDRFTYHFGDPEYVGVNCYESCLVILSGGAINFVVPDKRGFVEFYTSTNIDVRPRYYTNFHYKLREDGRYISGGGGGINGGTIKDFAKGCVRNSYAAISDVTEIQLYLSRLNDFDIMAQYRADVDCNNVISILDATLIQLHLANKSN
ncbi:MAG: hypothetical protein IJ433_03950 [Ruminococcus sp.]|nr:hypothetical protein [Ruminococcus sp.]